MRYLGIDYGKKRVGIAISDEASEFAFPHAVLENRDNLLEKVGEICKKEDIRAVIMGDSKNYHQEDNTIMKDVREFKLRIENELKLPVYLEPEFMTSAEAERLQGKNTMHDASAAALILKSYLEKHESRK